MILCILRLKFLSNYTIFLNPLFVDDTILFLSLPIYFPLFISLPIFFYFQFICIKKVCVVYVCCVIVRLNLKSNYLAFTLVTLHFWYLYIIYFLYCILKCLQLYLHFQGFRNSKGMFKSLYHFKSKSLKNEVQLDFDFYYFVIPQQLLKILNFLFRISEWCT